MSDATRTVGEALVDILEANGVDVVFGIPGVHTVELYRGLAASTIRHVTPRHEQGAGFMADGYARVSGKPGVCLLITGPGLTNAITAMAQAAADSVPMLVITGVNARATLGHGYGHLHELPVQLALTKTLTRFSHTLLEPADLPEVMARAFAVLGSGRPGPVHIEIPTDVMAKRITLPALHPATGMRPRAEASAIAEAAQRLSSARRPAIVLGGGARKAARHLTDLAERLDAPVVTTVNARGLLAGHPLEVPASPSLGAVRDLLTDADAVVAIGTEMGPTDFDMYDTGGFPALANLIRVDIDADQLARGPAAAVSILSSAETAVPDLLAALPKTGAGKRGSDRADAARKMTLDALSPKIRTEIDILRTIRRTLPGAIVVGDSTQLVYAGNLYCETDRPGGWFNSATGYGALGYAPPAAIGASIAAPDAPVVCIVGDGGIQFSLAELGSAVDAGTPVIFLVWNNGGYQEIENYMLSLGIAPEGVRPSPPDFVGIAQAYGLASERPSSLSELPAALERARKSRRPTLVELSETLVHGG